MAATWKDVPCQAVSCVFHSYNVRLVGNGSCLGKRRWRLRVLFGWTVKNLRPNWLPWHRGIDSGCKHPMPTKTIAISNTQNGKKIYVQQPSMEYHSAELTAKEGYANTWESLTVPPRWLQGFISSRLPISSLTWAKLNYSHTKDGSCKSSVIWHQRTLVINIHLKQQHSATRLLKTESKETIKDIRHDVIWPDGL